MKSYLGLLVQGKNDFEAIEAFRGDDFFARSLGLGRVPSCSTLRQRMDTHAADWFELTEQINTALLGATYAGKPVDFGALPCGYMALDWDTFVMNNEGTQKEEVGRTYQGVDGFTPSATYLGSLGYCLELALRPGVQHSAKETEYNLERLPSGKFDTNYQVCALAAVAMNILRLMGQSTLIGEDAPLRHEAKRRCMKTVMQELMFKAARMIKHASWGWVSTTAPTRCLSACTASWHLSVIALAHAARRSKPTGSGSPTQPCLRTQVREQPRPKITSDRRHRVGGTQTSGLSD